jgi:hypothetical protein
MAKLMTDLGLDISSDHVENEEVDNHNNCTRKSKKSVKLNKSENMKKRRGMLQKVKLIQRYENFYTLAILCV